MNKYFNLKTIIKDKYFKYANFKIKTGCNQKFIERITKKYKAIYNNYPI